MSSMFVFRVRRKAKLSGFPLKVGSSEIHTTFLAELRPIANASADTAQRITQARLTVSSRPLVRRRKLFIAYYTA